MTQKKLSPAKKSTAKKSTAKKSTAKKSTAKKSTAKKSAGASPSMKKREVVLVTGASGGLGRLVCRKLHRKFEVLALDRRPFPDRPKDIHHIQKDLRRKATLRLLKRKKPDCIVHLGVIHNPLNEEAFHFNLEGTSQLLQLAEQIGVRKVVFLSSANLYGPSARSSGFMTEEAPLLAAGSSPEVRDLISLDMMVQSFFWKRPETETVILRPVHIVGPHLRNAPSKYLRLRRVPTILGFDPMIQLVHEIDVVESILRALEPGGRGVFNIVGQGQAPLSRLISARNRKVLPVPGPIFETALAQMFRYHLTTFPSAELDHLRYSCLVDGRRAEAELNYKPRLSLKQTVGDVGEISA
jgi:UDP-glucose 4-epimerase